LAKISAGVFAISDPVSLKVAPLEDLAISIDIPNELPASCGVTGRYSRQFNYLSPPGDFTESESYVREPSTRGSKPAAIRSQAAAEVDKVQL
jgi:hypothetical protein